METQVFKESEINEAANLLTGGEVIAFPTETVYGLGAPVFAPEAIAEIFRIKQRPSDNPLIVHISSLDQVDQVAKDLPETFYQLAAAFFPGPLTLVVKKSSQVPSIVSGGLDTVAIRMPNHLIAKALIALVGQPLVAPSANLSGRPSSTCVEHVLSDFSGKLSGVIDGGVCRHGIESTVVDLVSFEKPTILRPGALSREEIEKVLSLDEYTSGPKSSPGMKYRHYAPSIPVRFFDDQRAFKEHVDRLTKPYILSPKSSSLYADLREAEKEGYEEIVIFSDTPFAGALANRLEKIISGSHSS